VFVNGVILVKGHEVQINISVRVGIVDVYAAFCTSPLNKGEYQVSSSLYIVLVYVRRMYVCNKKTGT
jgi:hypothetical protein